MKEPKVRAPVESEKSTDSGSEHITDSQGIVHHRLFCLSEAFSVVLVSLYITIAPQDVVMCNPDCRYSACMDVISVAKQQVDTVLENGLHCEGHTLQNVVMILQGMFNDVQELHARVPGDGHLCP